MILNSLPGPRCTSLCAQGQQMPGYYHPILSATVLSTILWMCLQSLAAVQRRARRRRILSRTVLSMVMQMGSREGVLRSRGHAADVPY